MRLDMSTSRYPCVVGYVSVTGRKSDLRLTIKERIAQ